MSKMTDGNLVFLANASNKQENIISSGRTNKIVSVLIENLDNKLKYKKCIYCFFMIS